MKFYFAAFFLSLLAFVVSLKFAVDGCLPDRGSRVFATRISEASVCQTLMKKDMEDRRSIFTRGAAVGMFAKEGNRREIQSPNEIFIMPTVYLSSIPADKFLLSIGMGMLLLISFALAFVFQRFVELFSMLDSQREEIEDLHSPTALSPSRKRKKRITATYRVLGRYDRDDDRDPE